MDQDFIEFNVNGQRVNLAVFYRPGRFTPLVCLHGFGSTKEDYADLHLHPGFKDRALLLWDAPGFGQSTLENPASLSIEFLVAVTDAVTTHFNIDPFHLSGHSMGGLTALLFANTHRQKVKSFMDIEGNLSPEDCFLSRQILQHPATSAEEFMQGFIDRVRLRKEYSSALYAAGLVAKVDARSFYPIFSSMVKLSDSNLLLDIMENLPFPRQFIYGEQNSHMSYLDHLADIGIDVTEIPHSGHFPMYSNPTRLWESLLGFINHVESLQDNTQ